MNNFLPNDVLYLTFKFLSIKDLANTSAACTGFYAISQRVDIVSAGRLHPRIVQENAELLWNYPDGNFRVDKGGRLNQIASYNIIGRLFKWKNNVSETKRVCKIVELTLREIYRLNIQGIGDDETYPRRFYVRKKNWFYNDYFPADYLAREILKTNQFSNNRKIRKAAELILQQAGLYEKNRDKYGLSNTLFFMRSRVFYKHQWVEDPRILWNEGEVIESFYP